MPQFYQRSYSQEQQRHSHDFCQLVLPVAGALDMQIDHVSGQVAAGETMAIVKAGQQHAFAASGDNRFLVMDLALPQQQLALDKQPAFLPMHQGIRGFVDCLEYQLLHRPNVPGLPLQMSELLLGLLPGQALSAQYSGHRQRVQRVRMWLDQHYAEPLDMKALAAMVHWSVRQLSGQFRLQLGQSVRDYHQQVRMQQAAHWLKTTELPVQVIAERVGYADVSSFSYRFRQCYGMSARQLRAERP
ncbi:AraC family transcriptional regulator [Oceanobacter kriegii]|uniref:AraC family transcriptional regulator n=1 Tax=Oceanobacter kriegii TaxID=64972 RepID=UPI0004001756|nr:AraC family transcriptional regulator [Oceanobacter kriegii]